MRSSGRRLHGPLKMSLGTARLRMGSDILPMLPSNHIYYDAPKLRARLDQDGYLLFKNVIPRDSVDGAFTDVANQLLVNGWIRPEDREAEAQRTGDTRSVPFPRDGVLPPPTAGFEMTPAITAAICGVNVMTVVRQVLSGGVECLPCHTLELSQPGESHGFHSDSIFTCRGTKLLLTAWVPLHDVSLSMGGLCVVRGSNSTASYRKIRSTYGSLDIEGGDISGDGCITHDPTEIIKLSEWAIAHPNVDEVRRNREKPKEPDDGSRRKGGNSGAAPPPPPQGNDGNTVDQLLHQHRRVGGSQYDGQERYEHEGEEEEAAAFGNPILTTAFEAGDLVLTTIYTMHSFLTNSTNSWRLSAETKWMMEGDDVGADPRFRGDNAVGLGRWLANRDNKKIYPRSMQDARKAWGLESLTNDSK